MTTKRKAAHPRSSTRVDAAPSLSLQVYQKLLARIVDGRIRPGELISRRDVAAELGVSIAPVAEAFASLDREGLLETLPRRGTRVRVFTTDDVRDHAIVRLAIETQVARLICGEPVRLRIGELRPLARELDQNADTGTERSEADVMLHHRLAELTRCALLVRHLEGVLRLSFVAAQQVLSDSPAPRQPASRHVPLLRQLMIEDTNAAEEAMRAHLLAGNIGRLIKG